MKKEGRIIFAIAVMFMLVSTVFAANYLIDITGGLKNTVSGNTVKRNTIEGEATFGAVVYTDIHDIKNISGVNAEGGIRAKTIVKRYNLGIVTNTQEMFIPIPNDYPNAVGGTFKYSFTTNKLKVQWQNWTGNTSFDARFLAYNG